MKKVLLIIFVVLILILGFAIGYRIGVDNTYTLDRIEVGQNGEQWAVIEVYNESTEEITMVDILISE